jgi:hypothetical protein
VPGVEIIVNNDSCDIEEIVHPQVTYHYYNPNSLCEIYKFLLDQSQGEYVYFLEDDDYLTRDFLSTELDADLIAGNYYPTYKTTDILISMTMYKDAQLTGQQFIANLNTENLQLSQHIYTRSHIADFDFPMDSNIHNDIRLTLHAAAKAKVIHTLNKVFFYQSTDGGDNISFPESTSRVNITKSLNFLENYEIFGTTPRTTRS